MLVQCSALRSECVSLPRTRSPIVKPRTRIPSPVAGEISRSGHGADLNAQDPPEPYEVRIWYPVESVARMPRLSRGVGAMLGEDMEKAQRQPNATPEKCIATNPPGCAQPMSLSYTCLLGFQPQCRSEGLS